MGSLSESEVVATVGAIESGLSDHGYDLTTGEAIKAAREVFSKAK